jgi:hypothetical protein
VRERARERGQICADEWEGRITVTKRGTVSRAGHTDMRCAVRTGSVRMDGRRRRSATVFLTNQPTSPFRI